MRSLICTALMSLVLTGCARRPAPPAMNAALLAPTGEAQSADFAPPPAGPTYQGKTVDDWSRQLDSPALLARHQAASALGQLDEAGFPHLLKGMHSASAEVRRTCLQAVYKGTLVKHERETFNLLVGFLKDRDPSLREAALTRLAWFEKRGGPAVAQIRRLALTEDDPKVRFAAESALYQISVAMSPTPLSHEAFNKKVLGQNP